MEMIPQAWQLAHGHQQVAAHITDVMDMDQHRWTKGMSAELKEKVRKFYKERYGQEEGAGKESGH